MLSPATAPMAVLFILQSLGAGLYLSQWTRTARQSVLLRDARLSARQDFANRVMDHVRVLGNFAMGLILGVPPALALFHRPTHRLNATLAPLVTVWVVTFYAWQAVDGVTCALATRSRPFVLRAGARLVALFGMGFALYHLTGSTAGTNRPEPGVHLIGALGVAGVLCAAAIETSLARRTG